VSRRKCAIRVLRLAEEDLAEIMMYVAADKPSAAEDLAKKIEKNISLLSTNPRLGRIPSDEQLVRQGYRYLVVDNYLIFYILEGQTIFVHRILHGARDYQSLF
jgi:plasmid stabilization system protein ParE